MLCSKCSKKLDSKSKFCDDCGTKVHISKKVNKKKVDSKKEGRILSVEDNKISKVEEKPGRKDITKKILYIFITLVIVGTISSFFEDRNNEVTNKEVSKVLSDVLTDTETSSIENKKYVDFIQTVLVYYRAENNRLFKTCIALVDSNVLELSTYEYLSTLQKYKKDIETCLVEYSNIENKYVALLQRTDLKAEESAKNYLNSNEVESTLNSFRKSLYDETKKDLSVKSIEARSRYYEDNLDLYKFLINNFEDYTIESDEFGEVQIYFYTNQNITAYNRLAEEIDTSSAAALAAETKFMSYTNSKIQESGIDVDMEDIAKFMYE